MHDLYDHLAKTTRQQPPSILESHRPKQTCKVAPNVAAASKALAAESLPEAGSQAAGVDTKSNEPTPPTAEEVAVSQASQELIKISKRVRAINKKLKKYAAIKAKGAKANAQQLAGLSTVPALEKELASLGPKSSSLEARIAKLEKVADKAKKTAESSAITEAKAFAKAEAAAKKKEAEKLKKKAAKKTQQVSQQTAKMKAVAAKKARAAEKKRRKKELQKLKAKEAAAQTPEAIAARKAASEKKAAVKAAKDEAERLAKAKKLAEKKARKAAEARARAEVAAKEREEKERIAAEKKKARKKKQKDKTRRTAVDFSIECTCTDLGAVCAVCRGAGSGGIMDPAEAAQRLLIECLSVDAALALCSVEDDDMTDL